MTDSTAPEQDLDDDTQEAGDSETKPHLPAVTSEPITVSEPVAAFLDAVNAHDPAALDAFTDDAVVDDWGTILEGRDAIAAWSEEQFVGSDPTFTIEDATEDGETIEVSGDWRSSHANGPSRFVFEIDGDQIARMTIREG